MPTAGLAWMNVRRAIAARGRALSDRALRAFWPTLQYETMRIDPAGGPFIAGAAIPAGLALVTGFGLIALPLLVLTGFFLYFFRDPDRQTIGRRR